MSICKWKRKWETRTSKKGVLGGILGQYCSAYELGKTVQKPKKRKKTGKDRVSAWGSERPKTSDTKSRKKKPVRGINIPHWEPNK